MYVYLCVGVIKTSIYLYHILSYRGEITMQIKTRLVHAGNSFAFRIPKALIDCQILDPDQNTAFVCIAAGTFLLMILSKEWLIK